MRGRMSSLRTVIWSRARLRLGLRLGPNFVSCCGLLHVSYCHSTSVSHRPSICANVQDSQPADSFLGFFEPVKCLWTLFRVIAMLGVEVRGFQRLPVSKTGNLFALQAVSFTYSNQMDRVLSSACHSK